MLIKLKEFWRNELKGQPALVFLYNFLLVMAVFSLCRIFFFCVNHSYFQDMTFGHFMNLMKGGLKFDLSALLYTNCIYLAMQLLPFQFRYNKIYQTIAKWLFLVTNGIVIFVNCADIAFFRFTNRRTTSTIFSEFENEGNITKIIFESLFDYWYITLFFILIIFGLYKLYRIPVKQKYFLSGFYYFIFHTALLALFGYFTVIGMRGGFGAYTRPITLSNANEYIKKNNETAIVLNTPFSIYRTLSRTGYKDPAYFKDPAEMEKIFSPIHHPAPQEDFKPLNVVVIIWESFSKEYSGFFNKHLNNGTYKGYTPFTDSLFAEGLTFEYSFCNGRKSIDGMPSVLSGIPMFIEPFILTPYSSNEISSIASLLKEKGYYSAFFHGAPNGSMGFKAYANIAGFQDYFGMTEYGNDKDFDGTWAIWDEEFLQFYADKMDEFKQPFVTSVFTASSHHPFKVPKRYEGVFPEGDQPIHKCIGYSDHALRLFFEKMSQYSWYENTLFVITADHSNQPTHPEYMTDIGVFSIPILFYHPGSNLRGKEDCLAQQIDIMPSILGYLNFDKPYFAFGNDLISDPKKDNYAVNYSNQIYQILKDSLVLQFDGEKTKAVYNFKKDTFLTQNLIGQRPEQDTMENVIKANIQQYITRMIDNNLTAE